MFDWKNGIAPRYGKFFPVCLTNCLTKNTNPKAGFPLQAYRTETYQKRF